MSNDGFCPEHWEQLKNAIINEGLAHLIASSKEEAKNRLENNIFEPLIWAHNSLAGLMFSSLGYQPGCPVCNLEKTNWITESARQARIMAESLSSPNIH